MSGLSDIEARMKALKAEIDEITAIVGALRKHKALSLVKREEQKLIKAQAAARKLNLPVASLDAGRCKHQQQPYSLIKPTPRSADGGKPTKPA